MDNKNFYFVYDLSSDCPFGDGLGIYTSYELALKAMHDRINDYDEAKTDVYLYCFLMTLDEPISLYERTACYEEGKWYIDEQTQ